MSAELPHNKSFAFTIFDDTDLGTIESVRPVYELLADCGLMTTKSVWPLAPTRPSRIGGPTLSEPPYLDFVLELKEKGFEIALHNATSHSATREQTQEGLERFRELIGYYPKCHANHSSNLENIYWGQARLNMWRYRQVYRVATLGRRPRFQGHLEDSPHFWGDLCRQRIQYVRNFVFKDPNTLKFNPTLPYHDPSKPYVNCWFSSAGGLDVEDFCRALVPERQQQLADENGVCILSTHFGCGFVRDGVLDERFRRLIEMLADRNGWFVPVGELLDYMRSRGTGGDIPPAELKTMERRWLYEKIRSKIS